MSLPELPPVPDLSGRSLLPPDPLPPAVDPETGEPDLYAESPLRSSTGSHIHHQARDWYRRRSLMVTPQAPVKSAVHPEIELWLNNVGDLDLRLRISQPPPEEWPLQRFLPRVVPYRNFPGFDIPVGTYVIAYHKINKSIGRLPNLEWLTGLKAMFPPGSKLILDFCIPDVYLDPIWSFSKQEFWGHPIMEQFDAIIAPNFSSYIDDPPIQRLLCEKMCTVSAQEAHDMGRTVIPMLCWVTEDGLRRQLDAIGALYPRVHTVYVQIQSIGVGRVAELWKQFDYLEKYLAPLPFRYIINGCTSGWGVRELCRIFPRGNFHLVNGNAWMDVVRTSAPDVRKAEMFNEAITKFDTWARGDDLPPPMPRVEFWTTWDAYRRSDGTQTPSNWIRDALPEGTVRPELERAEDDGS